MTSHRASRWTASNEGRLLAVAGDVCRILARGEDTDGAFAAFELTVRPGGGPPPHTHSREDELFYVASGIVVFTLGSERRQACAGTLVLAPRGVRHALRNESPDPARLFVQVTPAGLERFFEQVGQALDDPAQAAPPTIEQLEKLIALAPQFGVEIHG